ncbi:unnamed protein product [Rotaria sp. Silwood1]|nr:unnamed protein product [Rotaria sp. Silwood1]
MKLVLLFILFGVAMSNLSSEWNKFKRDYNKQYASAAEEDERKQIFIENVKRMRSYQQTHPDATFTVAINSLTDRRIEELVSGPTIHFETRPTLLKSSIELKNLPESLDWRTKGVITPVIEEGPIGVILGPLVATGIYDEPTCPQTDGNHAMQVVGYNIEGGKPYWLCKNSWGEDWGEKGYVRMVRVTLDELQRMRQKIEHDIKAELSRKKIEMKRQFIKSFVIMVSEDFTCLVSVQHLKKTTKSNLL